MICNTCVKLNPIPGCAEDNYGGTFFLTGLAFPDFVDTTIRASIRNLATGRIQYVDIDIDSGGDTNPFNIGEIYPLPNHPFEVRFYSDSGFPANFTLLNPDDSTEEGCCIEFTVLKNFVGVDTWALSSQDCSVTRTTG